MLSKNKILIIIIVVILFVVIGFLVLINSKKELPSNNKVNNLVICDSNKEKEISRLRQDDGIVKDIEERKKVLVGFYTTDKNENLQGRFKRDAEKNGWKDFIEGYAPPTPLLFKSQYSFQDGDLIEIEIENYEAVQTEGAFFNTTTALRVNKARKLALPTKQDFIQQAETAFTANAKNIFQCADSKPSDFPSFKSGIERTVVWDRTHNQALITYQGTEEYRGNVKVIDVSILLDQTEMPISISVGSKVVPLTL